MATLADELQNDFADSGDEVDQYEEDEEATAPTPSAAVLNGADGEVEMEDEDGDEEEDEEMGHDGHPGEAEEETQVRLERDRQALLPKDMVAVAKFRKSMQPVLDVSLPCTVSPRFPRLQ